MNGVQVPQDYRPTKRRQLLFTTKFPEIPGTHLIDLGRMKGCFDLGVTRSFEHRTPGLGIQCLNYSLGHCSVYIKIYNIFYTFQQPSSENTQLKLKAEITDNFESHNSLKISFMNI